MQNNILFLSKIQDGGEWIAISRLAKTLKNELKNKTELSILAFTDKNSPIANDKFDEKVTIKHASSNRPFSFVKKIFYDLNNARIEIKKLINNSEFDFYLVNYYPMMISLLTTSGINRKKVYFQFHGDHAVPIFSKDGLNYQNIIKRIMENISLQIAKNFIVPSEEAGKHLKSRILFLKSSKKIFILPNIVPEVFFQQPSKYQLTRFRKKYQIPPRCNLITYSGRIALYKGLQNLIKAFNKYSIKENNVCLVLAHPKHGTETVIYVKLKKFIHTHNLSNKVFFIQDMKEKELSFLYHTTELLVLPSDIEMAPLSISEALACGTCVMGTKTGNMESLIGQLDKSLILDNNSVEEIFKAMKYFFRLPPNKKVWMRLKGQKLVNNSIAKTVVNELLEIIPLDNISPES
jgi:glycosyltransferase involved in cell wall biosynthesis